MELGLGPHGVTLICQKTNGFSRLMSLMDFDRFPSCRPSAVYAVQVPQGLWDCEARRLVGPQTQISKTF